MSHPIPPQVGQYTTYPLPLSNDRWAYILVPGDGRFTHADAKRMVMMFQAMVIEPPSEESHGNPSSHLPGTTSPSTHGQQ